jgi:hypothetical protein
MAIYTIAIKNEQKTLNQETWRKRVDCALDVAYRMAYHHLSMTGGLDTERAVRMRHTLEQPSAASTLRAGTLIDISLGHGVSLTVRKELGA